MKNSVIPSLEHIGWDSHFEEAFSQLAKPDLVPARVAMAEKNKFLIWGNFGERTATVAGKLRFRVQGKRDQPAVGDWVAVKIQKNSPAIIEHVLHRKSAVIRAAAGTRKRSDMVAPAEQVIAANVDLIFIVSSLDRDFNLKRIERYLTLVYTSQAKPVILLNKKDLCADPEKCLHQTQEIAFDVPVHLITGTRRKDVSPLLDYFQPGTTGALLGSSGVGKSTIINTLLGYERQRITSIRGTIHKGRHTTTHRELVILPNGGILMDNPGMREIQLTLPDDYLADSFTDIETLANSCRFNDCAHDAEPGCAVKAALEDGTLSLSRYTNYQKLVRELHYAAARQYKSANRVNKEKWQAIYKKAGKSSGKKSKKKK